MDLHNHYDYPPRRRTSLAAAAAAAARLQTPSLTSLTSTTSRTSTVPSMLTSGSGVDSARGSATIIAGHSTPPLIDLDDGDGVGGVDAGAGGASGLLKRPLALDAGAGVTPTDKLRALLRQMEGEVRAVKPEPPQLATLPPGAHAPPPTLRRSASRDAMPIPTQRSSSRSPPRETEDEYSPPTPPPRITNPYLYSRRSMERRESEEQHRRSPSPPRRLPSRAIALRAAASAAAAAPEPEPTPRRDHKPTPLETFIASHPDPFPEASSSRTRIEQTPRTPSPTRKGKERLQYYDDGEQSQATRTRYYDEDEDEDEEEGERYRREFAEPEYEEPSPPRRRGLTPRRVVVETPPDTSAAFAAGLNSAGDEYDLEEDSAVPWREDDTIDSVDSGSGRRQRFLAAEERSHSRSKDYITHATSQTSATMSFATAPSRRQGTLAPDTSLPALPDPESSDEEDARAIRHREMLLRPFSRESMGSLRQSTSPYVERENERERERERERRTPEPEEPTRYDTARDSARFEALRASNATNATATPSFKEARSTVTNRSLYADADEPVRVRDSLLARSPTLRRKESLREIAKSALQERVEAPPHEKEQELQPVRESLPPRESPPKASPPREREREPFADLRVSRGSRGSRDSLRKSASPKQRVVSPSPALEESDTLPIPDDSELRYREAPSFGARSSFRNASTRSLAKSNGVRWSPEVETRRVERSEEAEDSWSPDAQEHSTPARPRWSPEEERRSLQRTPSREEQPSREEYLSREEYSSRDEYASREEHTSREERSTHEERPSPPRETHRAPQRDHYNSPPREAGETHRTPPRETRDATLPSTPQLPPSTSPASSPPAALVTPASKARPGQAPAPATPTPAFPATPANLKGMKTPRPPGAWGTPIPPRTTITPIPEAADSQEREPESEAESAASVPVTPRPPAPSVPDYALLRTPKPPGGWYSPVPAATPGPSLAAAPAPHARQPGTPTPAAPNRTLSGLPTPRPPGAWYNSPAHHRQPNLPSRFSSLRNEILPDSSVSSQGSASTGDVSFHRLRSPSKRSPPSKENKDKGNDQENKENQAPAPAPAALPIQRSTLQTPILRSPKRSPAWSPPARRVSSAAGPPVTPPRARTTSGSAASPAVAGLQADDSFELNTSWAGRLQRIVMSPIRRPPPSTALAEAQQALETASKASAAARSRVEEAQRAWLDALAAVPEQQAHEPPRVVAVARKGFTWGVFFFWLTVELVLAWVVFRVTLDYATSARLLSSLDPWHPQLASYALNVPLPAGLQAFAVRKPTPTNLFDLLDMLGITGGGEARVLRPPT